MKFLEKYSQSHPYKSAIIMEEGDYNLSPNKVKGMQVDYIFIPECDEQYQCSWSILWTNTYL